MGGGEGQALPLYSGLVVQLVLVHAVGSALSQWLPEALEDAIPLLQCQLKVLLQRVCTQSLSCSQLAGLRSQY